MKRLLYLFVFLQSNLVSQYWAKNIGGAGEDKGVSVALDSSGSLYVVGTFYGKVDFDPGGAVYELTSTPGANNLFMAKYDFNCSLVYAKKLGGIKTNNGRAMAVDKNGNLYLTGYFWGTEDFDPSGGTQALTSVGSADIFLAKYDSNGTLVFAKNFGGLNFDMGNTIAIDVKGNVYVTGIFQGNADFDPSGGTQALTSAGYDDIFFAKYDSMGNYVYAKKIGSVGSDDCNSIAIDGSKNVYLTGAFQGVVDFDPSNSTRNLTSSGFADIFFAKFDSSGSYVWANSFGGAVSAAGNSIAIDKHRNIYLTGYYIGPGSHFDYRGLQDIFFAKFDSSGSYVWVKSIGGVGQDYGCSIAIDGSKNVYLTGAFQGVVDFDPSNSTQNLTSSGVDVFFAKYNSNGSLPLPIPSVVVLTGPVSNSVNVAVNENLKWKKLEPASAYKLQLSLQNTFDTNIKDTTTRDTIKYIYGMQHNTKYYWRVRGTNSSGDGPWTADSFTTVKAKYLISSSTGPNGTITPVGDTLITIEDSIKYVMHANQGFQIDSVFIDNVNVWNGRNHQLTVHTFKNVNANHSIRVYFGVAKLMIVSNTGPNGTITPLGEKIVNYGDSIGYLIKPNTGFKIDSVLIKDMIGQYPTYVGQDTVYTFKNVQKDWGIFVRFVKSKYLVKASSSLNGKIAPAGDTLITHGDSVKYTMTSNPGYLIDTIYIDNNGTKNLNTQLTYHTFTNVNAPHSIRVTFIISVPIAPIIIKPITNGVNVPVQDTLKWRSIASATKYQVQMSLLNNFATQIKDTTTSDTTKYIYGMQHNTKYYWRVRGTNVGGDGPWSVDSFTTIISRPTLSANLLYPANTASNLATNLVFKWNKVSLAHKYVINISTSQTFNQLVKDTTVIDTTYKGSGLSINTKYYWRVKGVNVGGDGPLSEIREFTTGTNTFINELSEIPTVYSLSQNYPNPFNPSTTIRFGLPSESNVRVEIYNSLGQLIETLIDERLTAHFYEMKWESGKIPSGLYFYKLIAVDINNPKNIFTQTKKMMLMK